MAYLFKNNASAVLASTLADSDLSLTLTAGGGELFPLPTGGDVFLITVEDSAGNYEICLCTARVSDTLTITRAQEGTTAQSFAAGSRVEQRLTAGILNALKQTADADADYADSSYYAVDGTSEEAVIKYDNGDIALAVKNSGLGVSVYTKSTAAEQPGVTLLDSAGIEIADIQKEASRLRIKSYADGATFAIIGTNTTGDAVTFVSADPDSDTALHHQGTVRVKTRAAGATLVGSTPSGGNYTTLLVGQQGDGVTEVFRIGFNTSSDMSIDNRVNSSRVLIQSRDSTGTQRDMITASPRSTDTYGVRLHWNGIVKLDTTTNGVSVYGTASLSDAPSEAAHATRKDYVDATAAAAAAAAVSAGTGLGSSKTTNGYATLPGGVIIQWGTVTLSAGVATVTLPQAFPTACLNVQVTERRSTTSSVDGRVGGVALSKTQIQVTSGNATNNGPMYWFAIGY